VAGGLNLADVDGERHADELVDRAGHAQQSVGKLQFHLLDGMDVEGRREGVDLRAVDADFDGVPGDEALHVGQ